MQPFAVIGMNKRSGKLKGKVALITGSDSCI
ncbi:NAD(P)-dependent oxidoreductase, partial [Mammaliicoccus vitulinus]